MAKLFGVGLLLGLFVISGSWGAASAMALADCLSNPQQQNCSSFVLPSDTVNTDITSLCSSMSWMPGCSISNLCAKSDIARGSEYCQPFSILKTICSDMPAMSGCGNYNKLCAPGSSVRQCSTNVISSIPNTQDAAGLVKSICTMPGHYMAECERCPGYNRTGVTLKCDLLGTYSALCYSMPGMYQCSVWKQYCSTSISNWPLCTTSNFEDGDVGGPVMRMYFHFSLAEYVLFESWVPQNAAQFAATWFAIVVMAVAHELLKYLRVRLEKRWEAYIDRRKSTDSEPLNSAPSGSLVFDEERKPFFVGVDVPRALLQALEAVWGLLIMLVAMTYNVALFLALPFGTFIGTLLVGRFLCYQPKASCH